MRRGGHTNDFRARTVARVDACHASQLLETPRVEVSALALVRRTELAAFDGARAFVPVEPEPTQVFENAIGGPWKRARHVEIVDPHNELSACGPREEPRHERHAQPSEMQVAGG